MLVNHAGRQAIGLPLQKRNPAATSIKVKSCRGMKTPLGVIRFGIGQAKSKTPSGTLSNLKVTPEDIYSSTNQAPEHDQNLQRWLAKKENNVEVRLAMIPQAGSAQLRTA